MRKLPQALRALPVAALMAAALSTATMTAVRPAMAQTAGQTQTATITVTGEAMVFRSPDMATVTIGVTTVEATAAEALAGNSVAMQAVIDRLKAAGVAAKDIQTSNLSVNPNWSGYDSSSSGQTISGYTASNFVTVDILALEGLGAVLDAAVADGANTLNGVSFGLADPRPALDEARVAAVADARTKAELLANAAGVKLGAIVSISEGGGYGTPVPLYKADSAGAVPVQAGEVSYNAGVTVTWALATE
ncbi:SIMPL domain-containing protein [Neotabrizicola sp. VNH66]|uniref:SIMPL domain-containing protein n=1 Tax=Neotabrizicola sp. VNH66 TaxID=3400918 RepID=UPI003C068C07